MKDADELAFEEHLADCSRCMGAPPGLFCAEGELLHARKRVADLTKALRNLLHRVDSMHDEDGAGHSAGCVKCYAIEKARAALEDDDVP